MNSTNAYRRPSAGATAAGVGRHFPRAGRPASQSLPPRPLDLKGIGRSSDGYMVYDRPCSHHHIGGDLLGTVVSRVRLAGLPFVREQVDFGKEIGRTICVTTTAADHIIFAQRPGRGGKSRFVTDRQGEPCSTAVAMFLRMEDRPNSYLLITAFIGSLPEPEPWDRKATEASRDFWSSHALIWDPCDVIPDTATTECPWGA